MSALAAVFRPFIAAATFIFLACLVAGSTSCSVATPPALHIVPDGGPIVAGQQLQLVATRHYADGTVENVTRIVDWSTSSDNALRLVSPELQPGLIAAQTQSTTVFITARDPDSGDFVTSTFSVTPSVLNKITVNPSPAISLVSKQTHSVTATGTYTDGTTADITNNVLWSSSNEAVATVSNIESARGLVTANAPGNTSITAEDSATGLVGTTLVFVSGEPVTATLRALILSPNPEQINVSEATQYSVVGVYSDGTSQMMPESLITWSSSDPSIASISSTGLATGVTPGDVTITASAIGTAIRASAQLTVSP